MINNRDLERHLANVGFSRTRLDTGNRLLRDCGRLPNAGRGLSAPTISTGEAASVLLAYSGASRAVRAANRLRKLEALPSSKDGRTLLATIRDLLEDPSEVVELRISRVRARARIFFADGTVVFFAPPGAAVVTNRFENESVIFGAVLQSIGALLRGDPVPPAQPDEQEEGE